jgi:diguanylate cyclase (GGDEF)-like protein
VIYALFSCGVLPYSALIYESISIGVSVDALLLSLALADRIRILQREKLAAENLAHKNLQVRQEELERLVAQRTSELETARQHAEVLATTDLLTDIYNRRGLLAMGERDVNLAVRYRRPLSVVMFDLDHFKRVNDAYGHAEGDRVLCDVAAAVRRNIRNTDLFGRIGGEEFLLILPDTSIETSLQLAERLRRCIAEDVAVGMPVTHITASFGVAQLCNGSTLESLMSAADHALYRAKNKGRNRVESTESLIPVESGQARG